MITIKPFLPFVCGRPRGWAESPASSIQCSTGEMSVAGTQSGLLMRRNR
jgi:hypothetical protein